MQAMPRTKRWFVEGGTRFTNAFTTTPLCCPARASVLTGQYAHNHKIHTNYDPRALDPARTLPVLLGKLGYRSAIVGKYLNGWDIDRRPPGFDLWSIEDAYRYRNVAVNVDGDARWVDGYLTSFLRRRALAYLDSFEEGDAQPWFLYVAPLAPHAPFEPERRYADAPVGHVGVGPRSDRWLRDKPEWVKRVAAPRRWLGGVARDQLRTLRSVDDLVASLFRRLRGAGELRNTLAVFLSDNGFFWGEFGLSDKRLPYLPAVQIPLMIRWPGVVERGATDRRLVANIDVAPTILDAVRAPARVTRRLDGLSLLKPRARQELLLEYWEDPASDVPDWGGLLTLTEQYVEYYGDDGNVVFRELFDLREDPRQLDNQARELETRELSERLRLRRSCRGRSCRVPTGGLSD